MSLLTALPSVQWTGQHSLVQHTWKYLSESNLFNKIYMFPTLLWSTNVTVHFFLCLQCSHICLVLWIFIIQALYLLPFLIYGFAHFYPFWKKCHKNNSNVKKKTLKYVFEKLVFPSMDIRFVHLEVDFITPQWKTNMFVVMQCTSQLSERLF